MQCCNPFLFMPKKLFVALKHYVWGRVRKDAEISSSHSDGESVIRQIAFAYFSIIFSTVGLAATSGLILLFLSREQTFEASLLISLFLSISIFTIFRQIPLQPRILSTIGLLFVHGITAIAGFANPATGIFIIFLACFLSVVFYAERGLTTALAANLIVLTAVIAVEMTDYNLFSQYNLADIIVISLVFNAIWLGVSLPIITLRKIMVQSTGIVGQYRKMLQSKHREYLVALRKSEESELLKTAFLSNVSHEIRTPMNAILGFSNLLSHPGIGNEEKERFIELINQNGRNLMTLLDDIIDVSKMDSGQLDIKNSKVVLDEFMRDLHSHFSAEAKRKSGDSIKIYYRSSAPEDLSVLVDSQKLRQVMFQLMGNALKFTDRGFVEFGYSVVDEDQLLFHVKDTGIGIPYGREEDVFKRFSKFNQNRNRLFGGTGIGLSIAQSLVTMMGGRIWVEPQTGKGSLFYFTIPFHKAKPTSQLSADSASLPGMYNWQGRTFLVAEDEEDNFRYIEVALSLSNANLIWARDGKEAVDLFRKKRNIDLVLMDIKMPRLDGYSATRQIRQFSDVPVIAQTAYSLTDEKDKLIKAGCDDYISKPIGYSDLLYKIHKYVPSTNN